MTPKVTYAVKSAVNAYLLARTSAELHREKVDKIQRGLLEDTPYYTAEKYLIRGRTEKERITDPKDTWLMSDEESFDYLVDLKHELIKAGYKIESEPGSAENSYSCPALSAEYLQTQTQWLVIDTAAEMLGEKEGFRDSLLCAGLEKYNQFIDLVVKMVVNMPDFKNPLTGQPA